jgi:hypothetical protein
MNEHPSAADQFVISGFSPDKTVKVESTDDSGPHTLYLWTLPRKVMILEA